jgi:hypothetical protein
VEACCCSLSTIFAAEHALAVSFVGFILAFGDPIAAAITFNAGAIIAAPPSHWAGNGCRLTVNITVSGIAAKLFTV